MKIERVINGENVTIELTDEEVGKAYMEWQNMIDIIDDDAKQEAVLDAIFEVLDDHKGEE